MSAGMFNALAKAVAQLSDPSFKRVILYGVLGSIAAFVLLWIVVWVVVAEISWQTIPGIGGIATWMGEWFSVLGGLGLAGLIAFLTYFMFPPVMTAIVGIFLEDICDAVETRHYPNLPAARPQPITEAVFSAIRFLGVVVLVNLIAFPFYVTLLVLLGVGAGLYYVVNGYLVGREFYETVALRRLSPARAEALRRRHRGRLTLFGVLFVFLMTVPILNLIAPVLAAAAMVHFFEALPARREFPDDPPRGAGPESGTKSDPAVGDGDTALPQR